MNKPFCALKVILLLCCALDRGALAQDPPGLKRCEVRPGCDRFIAQAAECKPIATEGGTCTNGLLTGNVRYRFVGGLDYTYSVQFEKGRNLGWVVIQSPSNNASVEVELFLNDATGRRVGDRAKCLMDKSGRINADFGNETSRATCKKAIAELGVAFVTGQGAQTVSQASSTSNSSQETSKSSSAGAGRDKGSFAAPRVASVPLRIPSANGTRTVQFTPPRDANNCIQQKAFGTEVKLLNTCSQKVLVASKVDHNGSKRAKDSRVNGYEVWGYELDKTGSDKSLGDYYYDSRIETTSCYSDEKFCDEIWLTVLQECRRWDLAPTANSNGGARFGVHTLYDYYGLDCADGADQRKANTLTTTLNPYQQFNEELKLAWTEYWKSNIVPKASSNPDSDSFGQCSVNSYVALREIANNLRQKYQKQSGLPISSCSRE